MSTIVDDLAGAGSAGGAPPPAGDAPAAGAAGTPPPAVPWLEGADPDLIDYAAGKHFASPTDVVKAYRNFEKGVRGGKDGEVLFLPKEGDEAGWNGLWAKLGRPDKPEGYGLEQLDGSDPEVSKQAAELFHKLGVPGKQAKAIAEWWNGYVKQAETQAATEAQQRGEREMAELKGAWGAQFEANRELARRGARALGYDHETLAKIEDAIGPRKLMELMHKMGSASSEDAGVPRTAGTGSFAVSPDQAKAEIKRLGTDREFMAKMGAGEVAALEKWAALHKAAYPE